ncbi:MAG: glycosyltransferase [Planctomycetota bacterium]
MASLLGWTVHEALATERPGRAVAGAVLGLALPLYHLAVFALVLLSYRPRPAGRISKQRSVDVFVTAYDDPAPVVRRTLRAAVAMRYPHRTFLLDDGHRNELAEMAREVGAEYLRREDRDDNKAGNVNAALEATDGELIAIFDADHAPRPEFLDRALQPFDDLSIGFVQVMVSFSNERESLVARASAEAAKDFYELIQSGQDRWGAASLIGSNAVLRRSALESIGGYRPGLAEDLETSLALHGAGWSSAYVREPLAPGLAPADFGSFARQQLKWSSGVFEAGIGRLARVMPRLSWGQRLGYLARCTYYLVPVQFALGAGLIAASLVAGWDVVERLAPASIPTLLSFLALSAYARHALWTTRQPRFLRLRAGAVIFGTWPAYVVAALHTLLRRPVAFRSTAKTAHAGLPLWTVLPQFALMGLLTCALACRWVRWDEHPMPATTAVAVLQLVAHWIVVASAYTSVRRWCVPRLRRRVATSTS